MTLTWSGRTISTYTMAIDPNIFINQFGPEDTVPNKFNPNLDDIPDTKVIQKLREICIANCTEAYTIQYHWEYCDSGRFEADGRAWFAGELIIEQRDNTTGFVIDRILRSGCAEAEKDHLGISGMSTVALKNAALRGLGMAEFLYEKEDTTAPTTVQNNVSVDGRTVGNTTQSYVERTEKNFPPPLPNASNPPPPRPPARGSYGNRGGGYQRPTAGANTNGGRSFPDDWATRRVTQSPKSGRWQGTPYAQIPDSEINKWASGDSPNPVAVKEQQYRAANAQYDETNVFG